MQLSKNNFKLEFEYIYISNSIKWKIIQAGSKMTTSPYDQLKHVNIFTIISLQNRFKTCKLFYHMLEFGYICSSNACDFRVRFWNTRYISLKIKI